MRKKEPTAKARNGYHIGEFGINHIYGLVAIVSRWYYVDGM